MLQCLTHDCDCKSLKWFIFVSKSLVIVTSPEYGSLNQWGLSTTAHRSSPEWIESYAVFFFYFCLVTDCVQSLKKCFLSKKNSQRMGNSALQQMWQSDCRALSLNRWGHCTATSLYVTQLHSIPPPHTHTQTLHSTHSRWSECIGQWYLIGGSVMHINRLHLLPLEKWTFAV